MPHALLHQHYHTVFSFNSTTTTSQTKHIQNSTFSISYCHSLTPHTSQNLKFTHIFGTKHLQDLCHLKFNFYWAELCITIFKKLDKKQALRAWCQGLFSITSDTFLTGSQYSFSFINQQCLSLLNQFSHHYWASCCTPHCCFNDSTAPHQY